MVARSPKVPSRDGSVSWDLFATTPEWLIMWGGRPRPYNYDRRDASATQDCRFTEHTMHCLERSQGMERLNSDRLPSGPHYDCLVISDLHLGSDVCQAKLLEEFLIWAVGHCDQLVINGDIFDDLNFKRLTKRHFACLKVIRRNTDRPDFRLVWVARESRRPR